MKFNRIIIILILTIFLFSCYQAPESSSGAITVKLNSSVMKEAPAGFDGELKLAVFSKNDIDSLIDYPVEPYPTITYLGEFPTPLLANNSVPFIGSSGVLSLLNVPADRPLKLLIEHYGTRFDSGTIYFHSYSGVSETFEVQGGGTAEVAVTLLPTEDGTGVIVNNKGPLSSSAYFRIFADEDYSSFITISGTYITNLNSGTSILYASYGTDSGTYFTYSDAILPGRKLRLIVSANSGIDNVSYPDVGISGTFELQPGLKKAVSVTYYTYTSCNYFS